jgi:hypothetical protein
LSVALPSAINTWLSSALPCASAVDAGLSVGRLPAGRLLASDMPPLKGTALCISFGDAFTISGEVSSA